MNKKRSSEHIMSRILEVCATGASKTQIVYQSNLNFTTVNPYLDILIKRGLIESKPGTRIIYTTTEKGIKIMKRFKELHTEMVEIFT